MTRHILPFGFWELFDHGSRSDYRRVCGLSAPALDICIKMSQTKSVGKYLKLTLLLFILFFFFSATSYAHHKKAVLGESTSSSELNFPPVTAGPGLILPDSPFYFLDKVKQQIRLLIALNPKDRAQIHGQIAGERLAELRIMMSRNNASGISIALSELENETAFASDELFDAKAQGEDVKELSKDINNTLKNQRDILDSLESQATGALQLRFMLTKLAIKEAKNKAEDTLPEDELENEINDSLNHELDDSLHDAKNSTLTLTRVLEKLQQQASESAKQNLRRREEALKRAIANQDKSLRVQQELLKKLEEKRSELILKSQERALEKTRQAAEHLDEVENEVEDAAEIESEQENSESSDDLENSSNSGSGSSNSGSDSGKD